MNWVSVSTVRAATVVSARKVCSYHQTVENVPILMNALWRRDTAATDTVRISLAAFSVSAMPDLFRMPSRLHALVCTCLRMLFVKLFILFLHTHVIDVDECKVANGQCKGKCVNLPGSFECACDAGFTLLEDMVTCGGLLFVCLFVCE